jgi:hypothetical protein
MPFGLLGRAALAEQVPRGRILTGVAEGLRATSEHPQPWPCVRSTPGAGSAGRLLRRGQRHRGTGTQKATSGRLAPASAAFGAPEQCALSHPYSTPTTLSSFAAHISPVSLPPLVVARPRPRHPRSRPFRLVPAPPRLRDAGALGGRPGVGGRHACSPHAGGGSRGLERPGAALRDHAVSPPRWRGLPNLRQSWRCGSRPASGHEAWSRGLKHACASRTHATRPADPAGPSWSDPIRANRGRHTDPTQPRTRLEHARRPDPRPPDRPIQHRARPGRQ